MVKIVFKIFFYLHKNKAAIQPKRQRVINYKTYHYRKMIEMNALNSVIPLRDDPILEKSGKLF